MVRSKTSKRQNVETAAERVPGAGKAVLTSQDQDYGLWAMYEPAFDEAMARLRVVGKETATAVKAALPDGRGSVSSAGYTLLGAYDITVASEVMAILALGVILMGIIIIWISTFFAVNKYLNIKTDKLY